MKAYYTVELALLMPALLFVLYMPVYLGFELYTVTKQVSDGKRRLMRRVMSGR